MEPIQLIYGIALLMVLFGSITTFIKKNFTSEVVTVIGCFILVGYHYNAGNTGWLALWSVLTVLNTLSAIAVLVKK